MKCEESGVGAVHTHDVPCHRSACGGMTLYHAAWCPECAVVREKLVELGLTYDEVLVPDMRPLRKEVFEVSGQYYVPVLKDGDTILTETREILSYLDEHYSTANG